MIMKMVILHDEIKPIQNVFFPFSSKREHNLVSFYKKQIKQENSFGLFFFFEKNVFFFNPGLLLFQ